MQLRALCALLVLAGISGCGSNPLTTSTPAAGTHTYNGTASVGDFLTITLNTTALTLSYSNLSNGDSGTFPYTVNADGSYTLDDPNGNLLSAYEIPGYALLVEAAKAGPAHNTPALITAVETGPVSLTTFSGKSYNYMQFRTASGGVDVGSVTISGSSGTASSFWPLGNFQQGSDGAFHDGALDFSQMTASPSGTFLYGPDGGGGTGNDYVFGTAGGFFIVDTPNGSIISLPKAATSAFDPAVAGTYNAVFYQKTNAQTDNNNAETGTASTSHGTALVTAAGNITVTDAAGNTVINAALTPVADSGYLYGAAGQLADPCNGLFTFRAVTGTYEHDVFVTFVGNSVVFAKFSANLPWSQSSGYSYWYGVGLK